MTTNNDKQVNVSETALDSNLFQVWHESRDGEVCTKAEKLEAAIQTAMSVLEQIAESSRNNHQKSIARAAVAFLWTQLEHGIKHGGDVKTTNEEE